MEKAHEYYQLYLWHSLLIIMNNSNFAHLQFLANVKIVKEVATAEALWGDGYRHSSISCLHTLPADTETCAALLLWETYTSHSFPVIQGLFIECAPCPC